MAERYVLQTENACKDANNFEEDLNPVSDLSRTILS